MQWARATWARATWARATWAPATWAIAAGYSGGLIVGGVALQTRSSATRAAWLAWSSTNLANLRTHPVGCLIASAFLTDGDFLTWVAVATVAVLAAGVTLGGARAALLIATAHVIATVVSQAILAGQIAAGARPATSRLMLDVGASYIVVAALAAAVAYGSWPVRVVSGVTLAALSPYLFIGLSRWEVTPVGHTCAIVVALLLGHPRWRGHRRGGAGDSPSR